MKTSKLRSRRAAYLAALMLLLCAVPARAGLVVPGGIQAAQDYATDPIFASVGGVFGFAADGTVSSRSSGVLIAPDWVLTSGHGAYGYDTVQFILGNNLYAAGAESVLASSVVVYPGYVTGALPSGTGNDIALIHLSTAITDVAPAVLYNGPDLPGMLLALTGYGRAVEPGGTPGDFTGIRLAGTNIVESLGGSVQGYGSNYYVTRFGPSWASNLQPNEYGATHGDSGGGAFYNDNGVWKLAGLMDSAPESYYWGQYTASIRVNQYSEWIGTTVGSTAAVPEPASIFLFATGVPVVAAWVRRRRTREQAKRTA